MIGAATAKASAQPGRAASEDVADVAALIEHLGLAPAWVAGNSFGASITLRLAGERPELFRGLIGHEPPLFSLGSAPWLNVSLPATMPLPPSSSSRRWRSAPDRVQLPPDFQQTLIENAPTFWDEARDPEQPAFDLAWIKAFSRPSLLTTGDQSPPTFAPVVIKLADVLPDVEVVTFPGAGHIPHVTRTPTSKRSWLSSQEPEVIVQQSSAYIDPGKPWQNGTDDSFNGKLRDLVSGLTPAAFKAKHLAGSVDGGRSPAIQAQLSTRWTV